MPEQKEGLVDRYLNNKLSDIERAAFEIMMLEDTQLFDRVQLLDSFKRSLADERAALTGKRELFALPFRAWLQQPMSLAASVLVVGLALQVVYDTATAPEAAPASGAGIGAVFVVEATRGTEMPVLAGAPPYLFQIDAGPGAEGTTMAVTLRTADGAELLHVDELQVDASGWVRVVFEQPLAGDYELELRRRDGSAQTFALTLRD